MDQAIKNACEARTANGATAADTRRCSVQSAAVLADLACAPDSGSRRPREGAPAR